MTHSRPAIHRLLDDAGLSPPPRPRAELRRRSRTPSGGSPTLARVGHGRQGRRGRRRTGEPDPRARRDRCPRHRRGSRPGRGGPVARAVVADVSTACDVVEAERDGRSSGTPSWLGAGGDEGVDPRGQPAVQRGHPTRSATSWTRYLRIRPDARHGAAGGGGAVRRHPALEVLRGGERQGGVLGSGPHRRSRSGLGVRPPPERRVGAARDRATGAPRRRCGGVVRVGAHRRSTSAARCSAAPWPSGSPPSQFGAAVVVTDCPARGARRRRLGRG